jgi:PAS domain S-box-containing protein
MVLVSGYSGIGKSALVHEIHKPIVAQRGYFISGKFDQYKRNIPYVSLIQAFQELVQQLLTESQARLEGWREQLLAALGPNGQIIIDVIPEVELIIGPQPEVQALPPTETQNRFNLVFQNFIRVFAQKDHPLVIFLDDLQWADSASLKLLQLFITDAETQFLLILGAYRDNEVGASHPLRLTLEEIEKAGARVTQISLSPLSLDHVCQLLADTLHLEPAEARSLAELTFSKTHGNPFFVNEFLKLLYQERLLLFSPDTGRWQWNLTTARNLSGTDNVIELMTGKLQKLASRTQQVLKLAAAIGNQFELGLLATVYEKPITETAADLWEALEEGLVLPIGDDYKFVGGNGLSLPLSLEAQTDQQQISIQYKFLHDRVQQATYSLIEETNRETIHLQIGRLLLQTTTPEKREEKLFDIVNQLNLGLALITDPAECLELARLNLLAGQKAKDSTAYETAVEYLTTGIRLLPPNHWQAHYELAFDLHREQAYCTYLGGNHQQAEARFDTLIQQLQSPLDKGKIYDLKVIFYTNTGRPDKALQDGLEALRLLGRDIPFEPDPAAIGAGFMEIQTHMQARNITQIADIVNLPPLTDPHQYMVMTLLMNLGAPAFFVNPNLFTLIVVNQVNLSLQYGNHISSGSSYAGYGLILGSGLGDFQSGYEFGKVAIQLNEKFNNRADRSRVNVLFGGMINHWRQPARTNIPYVREAFHGGLEVGDLVWSGYGACHVVWAMAVTGAPLDEVAAEAAKYTDFFRKTKDDLGDSLIVTRQMVASLKGQTKEPGSFSDDQYDEAGHVARMLGYYNKNTIHLYYLWKLRVLYLFEQYAEAIQLAEASAKVMMASLGYVFVPEQHFYHSLALAALYPEAPPEIQAGYQEVMAANQAQMKIWADNAPANFRHKYLLVEAELACLRGEDLAAIDLYDQAIESARENGYIQNEAIANELAARFYLARGRQRIARVYLAEAHYGYVRWGATAKVEMLRQKYPQFLAESPQRTSLSDTLLITSATSQSATTTRRSSSSRLDLISVLKASQAISGEIILEQLLEKLMRVVIENAGAQRGLLILKKGSQFVVEAEGAVDREDVTMLQSVPVRQFAQLPRTVINYVIRTKSKVVLDHAVKEGMFTADPYIVQHQSQSILCLPVVKQTELIGLLYLENNLTPNVFTPDRLEVLELLSAQSAISLENAMLYEDVKRAEAEVRRSEEYFRALIENVSDIITILDGQGIIRYESPSIRRILGYEPTELIGRNALELIHPDDAQMIANAIAQLNQAFEPTPAPPAEFRFLHKNGFWRDFEAIGSSQLGNASVKGIIVNSRDITERKQAERERLQLLDIQRELTIARTIQQNLLPAAKPNWPNLDVICYNTPAREVSGDLYGYYAFLTPGVEAPYRFGIMVGDVTGKGMPAALLMAVSLSSFQSVIGQGLAPGSLLAHLDQIIDRYTDEGYQNCAMVYVDIRYSHEPETAQPVIMQAANAGCITPIIRRGNGSTEWVDVGGMPLGSGFGAELGYPEITVHLQPGDLIILTSDGLVEANNAADDMFGFERFEQAVAAGPTSSAEAMLDHLKREVAAFVGANEPYDDLTMVVIQV